MKYRIDSHQCLAHRWMMLKATESKRIWNWLITRIASFLNWQCRTCPLVRSVSLSLSILHSQWWLSDVLCSFTCACMLKRTASCNLSSCAGYLGKALTKTLVNMSETTGHLRPQCSSLSPTKWTLCMLPVVFPNFLCYKKATSVVSAVRTGTSAKEKSLNFSMLLWVWNGAAPVVNSHRGVYNSIVLSFSDCRKSKRPVLKTFDLSRSLFYCTVLYKKCWMF